MGMDRDQTDDSRVRARCLKGDLNAYGDIVDGYSARVINMALMMVGDRHEAEDIAQDAFIRAYRALSGFRGRARFSSWLYQIALNLCRDHLKRRARAGAPVPVEDATLEGLRSGDDDSTPDTILEAELSETMRQEIAPPPHLYCQGLLLRQLPGMDYRQVAAVNPLA